jgi:hypothetical protein
LDEIESWSCITTDFALVHSAFNIKLVVHQYSETNVMHFLFSLLRIKSLYMFPVPACCVSGLYQDWSSTPILVKPPEDEQVILETCRSP